MFIPNNLKVNVNKVFTKIKTNPGVGFAKYLALVIVLLPLLLYAAINFLYLGKIFPGIKIAGVDVGGIKPAIAVQLLSESLAKPVALKIIYEEQQFDIPLDEIDFSYDTQKSVYAAHDLYRTGNLFYDFPKQIASLTTNHNMGLLVSFSEEKLQEYMSVIFGQIAQEPIQPSATLLNGKVAVERGVPGLEVDIDKLRLDIGQTLTYQHTQPVYVKTTPVGIVLSENETDSFQKRSENMANKGLALSLGDAFFEYSKNEILILLDPIKGYNIDAIKDLVIHVSEIVNREPQNAIFVFQEGKVVEFAPAKNGVVTQNDTLSDNIIDSLSKLEGTNETQIIINIPISTSAPEITTESVNNIGIVERIGKGSSNFRGSISSRIHNIQLASQKFNGVLVKPEQIFSFNDTLDDVSSLTGYKQAYVIKDGKTVLGDGGGVCQVSTTLFRAALDAGLPIVERRSHSYRVGYYEQDSPPGLDATVYAPTTDLKIMNNTPNHILVQTQFNRTSSTLVFEIYGTSDGRVSTTTKPVVTSATPPPEDLYIDDPNLPTGEIKQIDYKAWGAKVKFNYKVKRNDESIYEKTFYSNYQPWQAKFLRGVGPVI